MLINYLGLWLSAIGFCVAMLEHWKGFALINFALCALNYICIRMEIKNDRY